MLSISSMSPEGIQRVRDLETEAGKCLQVPISTNHVLHAGMYARTVMIPANVLITGALIKLATVLILSGDATVHAGDTTTRLTGYHVIPACANRKQAFIAHADTWLTMVFPSNASTVEEAEAEFTDETALLISRSNLNTITSTRSTVCLE